MVIPRVKICGITNLADAQAALSAGSDALGFLFYKKSPRYISPETARMIIRQLPKNVIAIGVFVNAPAKRIRRIARWCGLRALQFHGEESAAFCRRFKKYKIIKAFRIKEGIDYDRIMRYDVWAYLFDTWHSQSRGGTGKQFNWKVLSSCRTIPRPVFLSGGLKLANIRKALAAVQPAWVDVSSGVESQPGKKDHVKVRAFIAAVKHKRGVR